MQAYKSVLGGFLIHLVLGTLYNWANITSAVTSYIRAFNPSITYSDTLSVYTTMLAFQGATMYIGGHIAHRFGTRRTIIFGGFFLTSSMWLSGSAQSLASLLFTHGCLFGIGIGLCYTPPISCATKWMPEQKGLATGVIIAGFGCGSFVFGNLAILFVNPLKESVESSDGYFSPDSRVVQRVPSMYIFLGTLYFICLMVGCFLIEDREDSISDPENERKFEPFSNEPKFSPKEGRKISGIELTMT
jgi:MFS family permease